MLPFTHRQFLEVFASYNLAVWPVQIAAYVLAAAMLASLARFDPVARGRIIGTGLGLMWLWTGVAYHWLHFTAINRAAWAFGALFAVQGLLFLFAAAKGTLAFDAGRSGISRGVGWGLVFYAAVLYPALGATWGPGYPAMPMFGITPCPVTIFTFGLLVLARRPVPPWLLVAPVLWSFVGGSAAFLLQVPQDWPLLVSAASVLLMISKKATPMPVSLAER